MPSSPPSNAARTIVLASTSPYRRALLTRLQIRFEVASPGVREEPIIGEPAAARALRLAEAKADALAAQFPDALLIGGDQTIADDDTIFDKPGDKENAVRQLLELCGRTVSLYTAVAVQDSATNAMETALVRHSATFRHAAEEEIRRYVDKESALDCAGGAQIEGLGISLIEDIQGGDPTALIGLPLIATAALLRKKGVAIP